MKDPIKAQSTTLLRPTHRNKVDEEDKEEEVR
jgi:hypothetical protein